MNPSFSKSRVQINTFSWKRRYTQSYKIYSDTDKIPYQTKSLYLGIKDLSPKTVFNSLIEPVLKFRFVGGFSPKIIRKDSHGEHGGTEDTEEE